MVYPNMLPSKSPTAQSPFLLSQAGRTGHDSEGAHTNYMDGEQNESPLSALSPVVGTSGGVGAPPVGSTAVPGGSTANAASKVERYRPRIFGFPTHETAKLHRWQERQRETQIERLERAEAGAPISIAPDAGVGAGTRTGTGGLD